MSAFTSQIDSLETQVNMGGLGSGEGCFWFLFPLQYLFWP